MMLKAIIRGITATVAYLDIRIDIDVFPALAISRVARKIRRVATAAMLITALIPRVAIAVTVVTVVTVVTMRSPL